jgi:excisionase family DNA binding protein
MQNDYMTATEVANYLKVTRVTIYRMIGRGQLPQPVRLSTRCSRWKRSSVEAAMAAIAGANV